MDIKIHTDTSDSSLLGDMDLSTGAAELTDYNTNTLQKLFINLRYFKGEWFLDSTVGVPWMQEVMGIKGITRYEIDPIVKEAILTTRGIEAITEFSSSITGREYFCEFKATDNKGTYLEHSIGLGV